MGENEDRESRGITRKKDAVHCNQPLDAYK
jgi:hypothetical protein